MTNNFNFLDVELQKASTGPKKIYLTNMTKVGEVTTHTKAPNVRLVTITEFKAGLTPNGKPYIKMTVTDEQEAFAEGNFWTDNSTPNTTGKTSMQMTAPEFVRIIMAANKMSEAEAKAFLGTVSSDQDIVKKLSTLVGKKIKVGFYGRITQGKDGNEYLNPEFGGFATEETPDAQVFTRASKDETTKYINKKNNTGVFETPKVDELDWLK